MLIGTFHIHHSRSHKGHIIPRRYEVNDYQHRFVCLAEQHESGEWKLWRKGQHFSTLLDAIQSLAKDDDPCGDTRR